MKKIILPLDFLLLGGIQTPTCGNEENMAEQAVSSTLLSNPASPERPASELPQYTD
ncbi:hypothetical protein [Phocaeicola sp. HCN-6420]|jgi:hypothetical protein|uniref:hypothetical protein n=1 Tax=Phocaeicola sp. HCN-6420 TaxID=3134673 RepID=UPI0003381183|nr:uncharacterized protein BN461_00100 [Bacteroides sp. CAG:1076]